MPKKVQDLDIGQRFGRLVVTGLDRFMWHGRERSIWQVRCDCGTSTTARPCDLRRGVKKSCGCLKYSAPPINIGDRFGRLVVIAKAEVKDQASHYRFRCDCGTIKETRGYSIKSGGTKSCGCLAQETRAANGRGNATHRMIGTKIYRTWRGCIHRCYNKKCKQYPHYGGRGIKVCDRWRESFEAFLDDVGSPPSSKHSLDRINVNGDYEPGNVRWATSKQQSLNKRKIGRIEQFTDDELFAELHRRGVVAPRQP